MQQNKNILIVILLIMLLSLFAIIFKFSSQDGEESLNLSKKLAGEIVTTVDKNNSITDTNKAIKKTNKIVRKSAHFSLYIIVGILLMTLFYTISNRQYNGILSFIIGFLYAVSDETHQMFVPGRSAQITDVCIDSARCDCWNFNSFSCDKNKGKEKIKRVINTFLHTIYKKICRKVLIFCI